VPITTDGGEFMKVIDRVGVAMEIARTVVERQLGPAEVFAMYKKGFNPGRRRR
jgi:hypothetical protein